MQYFSDEQLDDMFGLLDLGQLEMMGYDNVRQVSNSDELEDLLMTIEEDFSNMDRDEKISELRSVGAFDDDYLVDEVKMGAEMRPSAKSTYDESIGTFMVPEQSYYVIRNRETGQHIGPFDTADNYQHLLAKFSMGDSEAIPGGNHYIMKLTPKELAELFGDGNSLLHPRDYDGLAKLKPLVEEMLKQERDKFMAETKRQRLKREKEEREMDDASTDVDYMREHYAENFGAEARKARKAPTISATKRKIGTRMRGNDGKMWQVKKAGKSQRWMAGAETYEAPYGGSGALMDIHKDTGLDAFTPGELTHSSAIHGDFDQASLNYSGHQNIEVRAETFEAASTSPPNLAREKSNLRSAIRSEIDSNFEYNQVVWGPYWVRFEAANSNKWYGILVYNNGKGVFRALGGYGGMGNNPNLVDLATTRSQAQAESAAKRRLKAKERKGYFAYSAESFESTAAGGLMTVPGGGVHWAMQPDNNPDVQWIIDPNDPESHTIAVPPAGGMPPPTNGTGGEGGNGSGTEGGNGGNGGNGEDGGYGEDGDGGDSEGGHGGDEGHPQDPQDPVNPSAAESFAAEFEQLSDNSMAISDRYDVNIGYIVATDGDDDEGDDDVTIGILDDDFEPVARFELGQTWNDYNPEDEDYYHSEQYYAAAVGHVKDPRFDNSLFDDCSCGGKYLPIISEWQCGNCGDIMDPSHAETFAADSPFNTMLLIRQEVVIEEETDFNHLLQIYLELEQDIAYLYSTDGEKHHLLPEMMRYRNQIASRLDEIQEEVEIQDTIEMDAEWSEKSLEKLDREELQQLLWEKTVAGPVWQGKMPKSEIEDYERIINNGTKPFLITTLLGWQNRQGATHITLDQPMVTGFKMGAGWIAALATIPLVILGLGALYNKE